MAFEEITTLLGGWEGFELVGMTREAGPQIVLRLQPVASVAKRCSGCGEVVAAMHETTERRVRDQPILDATTYLIVPRARLPAHFGRAVLRVRAGARTRDDAGGPAFIGSSQGRGRV